MPQTTAVTDLPVSRESTLDQLSARLCRVAAELSDAEFLRLLEDMMRARSPRCGPAH